MIARGKVAEVAADLASNGVVGVAASYVDNSGIARVKTVPLARLEDAVTQGIGMSPVFDVFMFDDAITASPSSTGPVGDLRLFPDLERIVVLAAQPGWAWAPVDRLTQEGEPHPGCQRTFARRIADRAAERGLQARMGFEAEWVLDAGAGDGFVPATAGPGYGMDRLIEVSDYCRDLLTALDAESIEVLQLHPEYAPAQFELSVAPADPVAAADRILLVRHTIRAVTSRAGMRCSFAPAMTVGGVGNGCHLHTSLWSQGRTLMSGGSGPHGLHNQAQAFVAGVLEGLPALLAIGAPSAASYLRLIPQRWAAPYRCWGRENREAAVRLVASGEHANAEIKCLDAAANPYLLVGAVLALGLDGVERELELPPEVTVDPATLSDAELAAAGAARLPSNLAGALEHFRECEVLATAMGPDLFETIVAVRETEVERFIGASEEEIVAATRFRY
ncbi:MAG TPA: glutamine synthetase family protein [Solirubrobacteraceae bacterium]|nr:glutamine synthetase family protein [Solirubrobacteraceae bacterium]